MKMLTMRYDRWIFDSFPLRAEVLALCRIFYAVYVLFFVAQRTDWVAGFPQVFFRPPLSFARLFTDFPPESFFHAVNVLSVVLLLMLLVGYQTRLASIAWTLLVLVFTTFSHSLGKIDHMILFTVTPLVLSFSNWGAAFSMDAHSGRTSRQVQAWPLTVLALLIGFTMFTSGWWKAISSWLDPGTQAIQSKLAHNFFAREQSDLLAPFFLSVEAAWFWELLDWLIVGFEFLFFLAVFSPRWFRVWVWLAVIFHLSVLLMLNIDFSIHMTVYLPFFPWNTFSKHLGKLKAPVPLWIEGGFARLRVWMLPFPAAALVAVLYWHGSLYQSVLALLQIEAPYFIGLLFLGGGAVLWTLVVIMAIKDYFHAGAPASHFR